ncbi:hypothetical protein PR048_010414 [Dryococelus australis]|uniref:Uncharacterized protein n=1 Tax=Dryococelus australis TaxID=614101 RepID=A0ABQ9I3S9_9NEOP|nr:hypothetical protein PR048_010414 [Dryococelus australis]
MYVPSPSKCAVFLFELRGLIDDRSCLHHFVLRDFSMLDAFSRNMSTTQGGRSVVEVRLIASHLGEPGSNYDGVVSGFSHMIIVPNDAAGRRVFYGISCFSRPCITALLHHHLISPSSSFKISIGGAVARALASHHGDPGSIPSGFTPGFSHVGILLNDAAFRWVFSGYSSFSSSCITAPLHPRVSLHTMSGDDWHLRVPAIPGHATVAGNLNHFADEKSPAGAARRGAGLGVFSRRHLCESPPREAGHAPPGLRGCREGVILPGGREKGAGGVSGTLPNARAVPRGELLKDFRENSPGRGFILGLGHDHFINQPYPPPPPKSLLLRLTPLSGINAVGQTALGRTRINLGLSVVATAATTLSLKSAILRGDGDFDVTPQKEKVTWCEVR